MRTIKQVRLELFFASFVVLFQELVLIRWLPGQVRVLAYFPNLILLSAFLGLGVGCLRAGKTSVLWFLAGRPDCPRAERHRLQPNSLYTGIGFRTPLAPVLRPAA